MPGRAGLGGRTGAAGDTACPLERRKRKFPEISLKAANKNAAFPVKAIIAAIRDTCPARKRTGTFLWKTNGQTVLRGFPR